MADVAVIQDRILGRRGQFGRSTVDLSVELFVVVLVVDPAAMGGTGMA
jgi:hypothetical protein